MKNTARDRVIVKEIVQEGDIVVTQNVADVHGLVVPDIDVVDQNNGRLNLDIDVEQTIAASVTGVTLRLGRSRHE